MNREKNRGWFWEYKRSDRAKEDLSVLTVANHLRGAARPAFRAIIESRKHGGIQVRGVNTQKSEPGGSPTAPLSPRRVPQGVKKGRTSRIIYGRYGGGSGADKARSMSDADILRNLGPQDLSVWSANRWSRPGWDDPRRGGIRRESIRPLAPKSRFEELASPRMW